jgi:hypothetical protein
MKKGKNEDPTEWYYLPREEINNYRVFAAAINNNSKLVYSRSKSKKK